MPKVPQGGSLVPLDAAYSQTFSASGVFSPGLPISPTDPKPLRVFDFPVGANLSYTPRATEAFGFAELRAFANVELVRLAIETRKDQLERQVWTIKPVEGRRRPRQHDADARVAKVTNFFRRPDGQRPFGTWLRMLAEEMLTIDAPALEKRRNLRGDLIGLDVVVGDTIHCLVDDTGRRPLAPAPAFQQILKGRVWNNLTTDDLIYAPRNPRVSHLYGFSPVEQLIVTLNTIMRRQTMQLAHFTEGNTPAGMLNTPEGWTAKQIQDYQEWFDARMAGNAAERAKLLWGPAGSKYQAFKEAPLKDDFDEWLARVICYCFSLPPTPFIRQMNRSTSEADQERALEEGLGPLMHWFKRIADDVIQMDLGHPDLEFAWDTEKAIDPAVQSETDDRNLRNGSMTVNEVREARGLERIEGGDAAMIYTGTGAMPLTLVEKGALAQITPAAPVPDGGAPQPGDKPKPAKAAPSSKEP